MGDIYRLAAHVIVWLGPERDDSSHALDTLYQAGRNVIVDWSTSIVRDSESGAAIDPRYIVISDRAEIAIGLQISF
ncbi:hypothetical protein F4821DRAFT_218697 [Hypoxylon rubiginosum]|uniref:Uncharacterized protein n=1 Tax=Hypoxylon rubiginosum TaxID=110542 RepID=A0ACC0CPL5_9PEZI|nr:hypothetical protein F4821DRAFT_218697 [Hypoxylon rubiginosum]